MNTLRNLTHAFPFRSRPPTSGCGFLSVLEVEACLECRLSDERRDDFERHRRGGCAPCTLLAGDIEVFRGALESGPLPGEVRAFNDTQATVKAQLRQALDDGEARRGRVGVFGRPIAAAGAAVLLVALSFVSRCGF
jgi:hypothetical protein